MRKITVFFDGSMYVWRWLQPLLWSKKELLKVGYELEFLKSPSLYVIKKDYLKLKIDYQKEFSKIKNRDIVFLAFHHMSYFCAIDIDERCNMLKKIKRNCNTLVWLDCADSTGTCMFDVLPYVDIYLKKQLLKDRSNYTKNFLGQRKYVDYYVNKYNLPIPENDIKSEITLDLEDVNKLDVSWNVSLWNMSCASKFEVLKNIFAINTFHKDQIRKPSKNRRLYIFFNGQIPKESSAIAYQRRQAIEIIQRVNRIECQAPVERIEHSEYVNNFRNSICSISPFGYGEICNRDFEAFMFGNCLIKPSMEEIETFPNLFIKNKTYIPIDWDFEVLPSIIEQLYLEDKKDFFYNIAIEGQKEFLKYTCSKERKELFVKHIDEVLTKHNS